MPRGMFKSGRLRKVFVKTPGGKTHIHYRERKPQKAHCAGCGKVLAGVPQGISSVIRKVPRSARKPQRPYGGMLCSACTRQTLKAKARGGVA